MLFFSTLKKFCWRNQSLFQNIMLIAWKIREKPMKFDKFYGMPIKWLFSVISQARSTIFWNVLWFLILLHKTFSGSTMKTYFRCNEFLTPVREVGVFLKVLCGHNFCTTEICFAWLIVCLNKPLFVWRQKFYKFFLERDRLLCIIVYKN